MIGWCKWKPMPSPDECRKIEGPVGPGVYQVKNIKTNELIQFGIGVECRKRMKSFFPAPHGSGKRNNSYKREYILKHWQHQQYRTLATETRAQAKLAKDKIKAKNNHLFNT